jgi:hypothetical protein
MRNNKKEIETFEELTEKILVKGDFLSTYLRGHLMIEFLYVKILQIKPTKYSINIKSMQHSKLINALANLGYIDFSEKEVLLKMNKIRNKFSHSLNYFPSTIEMKSLFTHTQSIFPEFFDGFSRGLTKLEEIEEIELSEIEILIDFFMEVLYNMKCKYDFL